MVHRQETYDEESLEPSPRGRDLRRDGDQQLRLRRDPLAGDHGPPAEAFRDLLGRRTPSKGLTAPMALPDRHPAPAVVGAAMEQVASGRPAFDRWRMPTRERFAGYARPA